MTKISLAMIVRNAADSILPCLLSAQGAYDELVVVDTGSTDGTQDAILSVDPSATLLKWDDPNKEPGHGWISDFAYARNLSFDACTGDAIFWLDADDVLEHKHPGAHPGESMRSLIQSFFGAGREPRGDAIEMRYDYKRDPWGNTMVDAPRTRVVRNGYFRWKWPVHEDLRNLRTFSHVDSLQGAEFVLHRKKDKDDRESAERNLWIMQRYMNSGQEMDGRLWANVAGSYLSLGMHAPAVECFGEALQTSAGDHEAAYANLLRRGDALKKLGQIDAAMRDLSHASVLFPNRRQPWNSMAETAMEIGQYDKALALVDMAERIPASSEGFVAFTTAMQASPVYVRAMVHMNQGQYDLALEGFRKLARAFPGARELEDPVRLIEGSMERQGRYDALLTTCKMLPASAATKLLRAAPEDLATMPLVAKANRPERRKGQSVIVFYCGRGLDPWGPSSLATGIGGSEEAVILLSREFAALGWRVEVYAFPSAKDQGRDDHGVIWMPYSAFDPDEPSDIFIGWRQYQPHAAFHEKLDRAAEQSWLWLHDTIVPDYLQGEWCERLHGVFCLSESHASDMPEVMRPKVVLTTNGLNKGFFREGRNDPKEFIYASSPDRGLLPLLRMWPSIQQGIPGSRLHIYYGFTKHYLAAMAASHELRQIKVGIDALRGQHGVVWHGMVGQEELAQAFADCGFLLYPTSWHETSCLTLMKAQAMGCIPITSRYQESALPETAQFDLGPAARPGRIEADAAWQAEYVSAALAAAQRTDLGPMRDEMQAWARNEFSWSKVAKSWIKVFRQARKPAPQPEPVAAA